MNDRGRPEKLTDNLKLFIIKLQRDRKKKLKAPAVQSEIRNYLEKEIKAQAREQELKLSSEAIKETIEERLPGLSSIQKYLSDNKDRDKPSELDNTWHLGTISNDKHPIPAEALPYIFLVQIFLDEEPDFFKNPPPQEPLTIRQAIWISRLYSMIRAEQFKKIKYQKSIAAFLFGWAKAYSQREIECQLAGIDFDTTSLDKKYRNLEGYPLTVNKTTIVFNKDRSFSIDTIDEKLLEQFKKKDGEK